jgi:hypothetical protein
VGRINASGAGTSIRPIVCRVSRGRGKGARSIRLKYVIDPRMRSPVIFNVAHLNGRKSGARRWMRDI